MRCRARPICCSASLHAVSAESSSVAWPNNRSAVSRATPPLPTRWRCIHGPPPATPGRRTVATLIDHLILVTTFAWAFNVTFALSNPQWIHPAVIVHAGGAAWRFLYLAMTESISVLIGKAVSGIRVATPEGRPAGIGRVVCRSLVFVLSFDAIALLTLIAAPGVLLDPGGGTAGPLPVRSQACDRDWRPVLDRTTPQWVLWPSRSRDGHARPRARTGARYRLRPPRTPDGRRPSRAWVPTRCWRHRSTGFHRAGALASIRC